MYTNTPASGGTTTTVIGTLIGTDETNQVRMIVTATQATAWRSFTSVKSKVGTGIGVGARLPRTVVVTNIGQIDAFNSLSHVLTFNMVTTFVTVKNAPQTSGVSVTVVGIGVGANDADLSIKSRFDGSAAEGTIWKSSSTLQLKTHTGFKLGGNSIGVSGWRVMGSKTLVVT